MPERPSNPTGTRIRRWWTEEEDEVLCREADYQLAQGSLRDWNRIAAKLPGRTNKDCRKRWSKVCKDVRKGAWSQAEDQRLQHAVAQNGYRWTHVAESVGTRHADQCAKRWQHFLDPNLDHSEWLPDDDERLIQAVEKYGRKWKVIGEKEFPGRSATDLKNRHVILERKRSQSNASSHVSTASSTTSSTATANVPEMTLDRTGSSSSLGGSGASSASESGFRDDHLSIGSNDFSNFELYSGSVSPSTQSASGVHTPFGNGQDGTINPLLSQMGKDLNGSHMHLIPDLDDPNHLFTTTPETFLNPLAQSQHQHHQHQHHQHPHHAHNIYQLDTAMDLGWTTPTGTPTHLSESQHTPQAHHRQPSLQMPTHIIGGNGSLKQEFDGGASQNSGSTVNTPTGMGPITTDPESLAQFCESFNPASTLILEDVQPDMVNNIMNVLFTSKSKVRMKLISQE